MEMKEVISEAAERAGSNFDFGNVIPPFIGYYPVVHEITG